MAKSADYNLGKFAFLRGWFAVAESGRVVMLGAYCPHMGTHLGRSPTSATVISDSFLEGDSIRCPFHAWRFGPDGKCNHIPYHNGPFWQSRAWYSQFSRLHGSA
jgi:3-ketosteroid 9alpha-monooxygenase subunit A